MSMVDSGTREPLPGVIAVYHLQAEQGTLTGHGGRRAELAIFEATTDKNGILYIPTQKVVPNVFFFGTNYQNPVMYIFKGGYEPEIIMNEQNIIPELAETLRWEKNGRTVLLKRQDSADTYLKKIDHLMKNIENLYRWPHVDRCTWKKTPLMISAIEQEIMLLEKDDKCWKYTTPLRALLSEERHSGGKNNTVHECGSPREFFSSSLGMCTGERRPPKVQVRDSRGNLIQLKSVE